MTGTTGRLRTVVVESTNSARPGLVCTFWTPMAFWAGVGSVVPCSTVAASWAINTLGGARRASCRSIPTSTASRRILGSCDTEVTFGA
jgi:hypothetical protein